MYEFKVTAINSADKKEYVFCGMADIANKQEAESLIHQKLEPNYSIVEITFIEISNQFIFTSYEKSFRQEIKEMLDAKSDDF